MKDITHYNKRCAEIMGLPLTKTLFEKNDTVEVKITYHFNSDWREQIPVWQKIVVWVKDFIENHCHLAKYDVYGEFTKQWIQIREKCINEIFSGTPETAFTILCQAIDFIDNNPKSTTK